MNDVPTPKTGIIEEEMSWLKTLVIFGFLILLVMVGQMLLDFGQFNNAVYKEYSEKITTLEDLRASNEELLKQNKDNQELIIQLLRSTPLAPEFGP